MKRPPFVVLALAALLGPLAAERGLPLIDQSGRISPRQGEIGNFGIEFIDPDERPVDLVHVRRDALLRLDPAARPSARSSIARRMPVRIGAIFSSGTRS